MNQTEKVAKWLFENEQGTGVEDWDSIQGRPLWEKVVKRYLAKAKEILDLIDQQGEPVGWAWWTDTDERLRFASLDKDPRKTTNHPIHARHIYIVPPATQVAWAWTPSKEIQAFNTGEQNYLLGQKERTDYFNTAIYLHPPASQEREALETRLSEKIIDWHSRAKAAREQGKGQFAAWYEAHIDELSAILSKGSEG